MARKRPKRPTAAQEATQGIKGVLDVMERLFNYPPPNLGGMANRLGLAADHLTDAFDRRGLKCVAIAPNPKSSRALNWTVSCNVKRKNVSGLSGGHCKDQTGNLTTFGRCKGKRRKIA